MNVFDLNLLIYNVSIWETPVINNGKDINELFPMYHTQCDLILLFSKCESIVSNVIQIGNNINIMIFLYKNIV